ncbi:hypothetical protein ACHAAC_05975 [Aeromicrobium sp. CF4.19]|uniref:hypothetical protein n=1 Tax=Aeromicrobium sp. CF4.19 TaxID=3373082 RepID=UPI003EE43BD8
MRRRSTAGVLLLLVGVLLAGPASASEAPEPTPAPSTTTTPTSEPSVSPSPQPSDGIREIPTEEDEGADVFSVVTILIFFAIAMGILVLIIRTGMRAADRED